LTSATLTFDRDTGDLLASVAAGIVTGLATPLMQLPIDRLVGGHGYFRVALLALPFALLVLVLVGRVSRRWGKAALAALVTALAFVVAVATAIWLDGQAMDLGRLGRNLLSGLGGGLVGAGLMAVGIALLAGPRAFLPWLPMLILGTLAGSLLALDNMLDFEPVSVLYPIWQAGVAAGLTLALRRS
jgi:phosphoglycerol transferase MdoB-like AlkP superfamily enzyme